MPRTGSPNAASLRPGFTAAPEAAPAAGAGAGPLRSRLLIPRLTARSPLAPLQGGVRGRSVLPAAPSPPAVRGRPGAGAWTSSRPSAPPGAAGPVREGRRICMRPAARQRRPRPRRAGPGWPGRVGGWALSRAPRSRLAPPQAEPPSPAPSVSLPCSRRGRSDLQRSRGARSDRLGAAPPGPGDAGGRGRSPPAWAPRHRQVRAPAPEPGVGNPRRGSRGPAACGCLQSGALRGWEPTAGSLFPRSTSLPSSLAPLSLLSPFSSPSVSLHPAFSLPVCLFCPFPLPLALSPPPLPLCLFLPLPFLSCLSLCLFPLSFPSPVSSLSPPLPFSLSCFPLLQPFPSPSRPASRSGPRLPSRLPSSLGRERTGRCVSAVGEEGRQPQLPEGSPQEEREESAVGRVLSPAPFPKPLLAAPSLRLKFRRPALTPAAEGYPPPAHHLQKAPLPPSYPFPSLLPMTPLCLSDTQAASFDLFPCVSCCHSVSVCAGQCLSLGLTITSTESVVSALLSQPPGPAPSSTPSSFFPALCLLSPVPLQGLQLAVWAGGRFQRGGVPYGGGTSTVSQPCLSLHALS